MTRAPVHPAFLKPIVPRADGFSFSGPRPLRVLRRLLAFLMLFSTLKGTAALAQEAGVPFEVARVRFIGNESFSSDILTAVIRSRESPGGFSKFLYRSFGEKLGSRPEYFDRELFAEDALRLEVFYRNEGFYNVLVTPEARLDTTHDQATLLFLIKENTRSHIDSVVYAGLEGVDPEVLRKIYADPLLKVRRPYVKAVADAEIRRILGILNNGGYPVARYDADHSGAFRFLSTNNFTLRFTFVPGRQFHFGSVEVVVDPPRADIESTLVLRHLEFSPGEIYSDEKKAASQRNLNRLELFETARIVQPRSPDTSALPEVPIRILVHPRDRHELSPEVSISDENNAFNLGLGLGYTNRNFFGDGRTMNLRGRTRFQSLSNWDFGSVFGGAGFRDSTVTGALELQFQILQPYLFTRTLSGSWETSIIADKQQHPYIILSILRNKLGLSNRFATYTYGSLDWTLERVSPEILVSNATINQLLPSLREEDKPQFNSILTASLQRDKTNDVFSPSGGFFHSITLEESGILPNLLAGIRGTLPFTQYYKMVLFGRWYDRIASDTSSILALKLKTGYQSKYGASRSAGINIPLNRRFFAGGSGSVRGWRPRELDAIGNNDQGQLGGNVITEGNVELRVNHFRGMGKLWFLRLDNVWGVYFLDAGNVWSGLSDVRLRQVAVAAGIGFRYETYFGPFRIDYGFKVYDPADAAGHQTIFKKRFWGETFSSGVIHFGIGHAF